MKRIGIGIAAAVLVMAAPLSASAAPSGLNSYYSQTLDWHSCSAGQCAQLRVPLDYSDLSKGDISIAVSRIVHSGATSQGSIVINPGGPGESGLGFAWYAAKFLAPAVAKEFDFIGFDPRGVGKSAPVTCMTPKQTASWLAMDSTPDNPKEIDEVMRAAARISKGCLKFSPRISPFVGTPSTAQDLDLLRSALGEDKLNWLGFSYGTALGTTYLETFPDRVGRFVLDGALNPELNSMQISAGQSVGFQRAFQNFAADCANRKNCSLGQTPAVVTAKVNALLARLDQHPLRTDQGPQLTQALGMGGMLTAMYTQDLWQPLSQAIEQALAGNGTGLLELAWSGAEQIGPTKFTSNVQSAYYAIDCWDNPKPPGAAGFSAAAKRWSANAPVPEFAKSIAWSNAPCTAWFDHNPQAPAPAATSTKAPILVIGTRFDPATPYEWSRALSSQLPTSTLLTYEGNGHTAYGSGSNCIDDLVDQYLLRGTLPAKSTSCPA
ncbi:MAG: alpha/beta hydrolase [Actinomycetota bacterium]|nr:alpha/beta hydrolase [Actinomycetota bacterium]MDP2288265.1 alpha/beta hydrolase [Actinomycetota bacterium]